MISRGGRHGGREEGEGAGRGVGGQGRTAKDRRVSERTMEGMSHTPGRTPASAD